MPEVVYYVVGFVEDTRHAVEVDPYEWTRQQPEKPMRMLCGRDLLVALPGSDRPPPAPRLLDGSDALCPRCAAHDAAMPMRQRVFTAQHWHFRAALDHRRARLG